MKKTVLKKIFLMLFIASNGITPLMITAQSNESSHCELAKRDIRHVRVALEQVLTAMENILSMLETGDPTYCNRVIKMEVDCFTYRSEANTNLNKLLSYIDQKMKRIIAHFRQSKKSGDALAFVSKGQEIITFEEVVKVMTAYQPVLLALADQAHDNNFKEFALKTCEQIRQAKIDWDKITAKQMVALSNAGKALRSGK